MNFSKLVYIMQGKFSLFRLILIFFDTLIVFIDYIIPKDNNLIVFGSNTGEYPAGDPKALHDYIIMNYPEIKVYYYIPFNKKLVPKKRIQYILSFAKIFFTSKFLISSHPPRDFFPYSWSNKKIFINTWHGTPLKAMFYADTGESRDGLINIQLLNKKTTKFLVASELESKLIKYCFRLDLNKFLFLGHPRNDLLLKNNLELEQKIKKSFPSFKKILLYCPTYRRDSSSLFFPFSDFDLDYLNEYLEKNELIMLVRGHLFNPIHSNIYSKRIINFNFEIANDINLYLPLIDILITDYSSIYIDYLLLNRPCIFIPYDYKEYISKRGLLLDYNKFTPGPKCNTFKDVIDAIEQYNSGIDIYTEKRERLRILFHKYQTSSSCSTIIKTLQNWTKK